MKKISLGLATLAASLAITPAVFAAEQFGTVEGAATNDCMINDETPTPTIIPQDGKAKDVTIAYDVSKIKYVEPEIDLGRTEKAAWLGIKVTAPLDINNQTAAEKVAVYINGEKKEGMSLYSIADNDPKDTGPYFTYLYGGITEDELMEATKAGASSMTVATFGFDWDNNEVIDQNFIITVNTTNLTLYDTDGEASDPLFTPEEAIANIEAANADDDQPAETPAAPAEEDNTNPDTADPVALYATIAVVALLGLGATAVVVHKSRR